MKVIAMRLTAFVGGLLLLSVTASALDCGSKNGKVRKKKMCGKVEGCVWKNKACVEDKPESYRDAFNRVKKKKSQLAKWITDTVLPRLEALEEACGADVGGGKPGTKTDLPLDPKAQREKKYKLADAQCKKGIEFKFGCNCGDKAEQACAERNCVSYQGGRRLAELMPAQDQRIITVREPSTFEVQLMPWDIRTPYNETWTFDDITQDCSLSKEFRELSTSSWTKNKVYQFEKFPCKKNMCDLSCAAHKCPLDISRELGQTEGWEAAQAYIEDNYQMICNEGAASGRIRPKSIACESTGCTNERCCDNGGGCIDQCGCMMGRPYTHDDGALTSRLEEGASEWTRHEETNSWDLGSIPSHLKNEVAQQWANGGLAEHASVASFNRQVIALMVNGAPAKLLNDAMQGAQDEVDHAKRSFAIASQLWGREVGPGVFPEHENKHRFNITELALDTLVEGGIGETFAATRAGYKAGIVTHSGLKANYARIRDDEARHAATAWQTLSWAVQQDPSVAKKLRAKYEQLVGPRGNANKANLKAPTTDKAKYGIIEADMRARVQDAARPLIDSIAALAFKGELKVEDDTLASRIAKYFA